MVSSKVMALMLSEARMASLSAKVGSSLEGTLAERMTHISQRLTLTARRSARLSGEPCQRPKQGSITFKDTRLDWDMNLSSRNRFSFVSGVLSFKDITSLTLHTTTATIVSSGAWMHSTAYVATKKDPLKKFEHCVASQLPDESIC